jgi:hypothetical protein
MICLTLVCTIHGVSELFRRMIDFPPFYYRYNRPKNNGPINYVFFGRRMDKGRRQLDWEV